MNQRDILRTRSIIGILVDKVYLSVMCYCKMKTQIIEMSM